MLDIKVYSNLMIIFFTNTFKITKQRLQFYAIVRENKKQRGEQVMEIAEVLKELRGDMTKTEFSKVIDCSKSILTMYEKGMRTPPIATLQKIADATNTELIIEFREKEHAETEVKYYLK